MVGVIFFFEDSRINIQSGRDVDIQMWRETIKPLGGTHMIMIDTTAKKLGADYQHSDEEIKFERVDSLDEARKKYKDLTWIFLAPERSIPEDLKYETLDSLKHPKDNVIYVTGPDSAGLDLGNFKLSQKDRVVTVPTKQNYDLWAVVVAGMVLYDRTVKEK